MSLRTTLKRGERLILQYVDLRLRGSVTLNGQPLNAGGESALIKDPDPTLGGDLDLNGHDVSGNLDDPTLTIDGGGFCNGCGK
jgi:hypothetical protein